MNLQEKMKGRIFVALLFVVSIEAQYFSTIPCRNDHTCRSVLDPSYDIMCLNGICMCANDTTRNFSYCSTTDVIVTSRQRVTFKKECNSDEDCSAIEGAKCHNETTRRICDCEPHMLVNMEGDKCLKIATEISAKCTENLQCSTGLTGAECVDGQCQCRPNFHYAETAKQCIVSKGYGETCTTGEDHCFQLTDSNGENVLGCLDNVCKCKKHYIHVNGFCQYSAATKAVFHTSVIMVLVTFTIKMF